MKADKLTVHYGPGMKSAHCAICRHFEKPDACELVKGKISPEAWCKLFARKA